MTTKIAHDQLLERPEVFMSSFGTTVSDWEEFVAYLDTNQVSGILDTSLDLTGVTTHTITNSITIRGVNGATLSNADDELFYLANSATVKFQNVGFDAFTAMMLDGTGVVDKIIYDYCTINACVGIGSLNLTSLALFSFHHTKVTNCAIASTWCSIRADIAKADVYRNRFDDFSSTGDSCTIFLLGNTQLADQPDTGNYFIDHNIVDGVIAAGTGSSGEVHFMLAYGDYFQCDHNIVKNVRGPNRASTDGVEGIYLKMQRGTCSHNMMYMAGSTGGGNKGAMINIKGTPLGYTEASPTKPISHLISVDHNICDAGDGTIGFNGVRCEGDFLSIQNNRTYHCYYGVMFAGDGGTSPDDVYDVLISGNVISKTTGPSGIWVNSTCEGVSIVDNQILRKSSSPIFSGDDYGIFITSANRTGVIDDMTVSRNKIIGFDFGIGADFTGITVDNWKSCDNEIHDCTSAYVITNQAGMTNGLISGNKARLSSSFYSMTLNRTYIQSIDNYRNGVPSDGYSTANVSNPPTDAELDALFGTAAVAGAGFRVIINDNNADTNVYSVWSDGTSWFYTLGTKAV